jgi:hypothetical protein
MKRVALIALAVMVAASVASAQQAMTPPPAAGAAQQAAASAAPRMPASPPGTASTSVGGKWEKERYTGGKWITIEYSRPILRGRTGIFGTGADYGKKVTGADATVWRVGANVTTRLKTQVPLVFGEKTIAPGDYSVFVDLKESGWTLILSTQPYQEKYDPQNKTTTWGSYNYDPKFDVLRVPMKVMTMPTSMDQFSIFFVNMTPQGGTLVMWWDTQHATVAFKLGQ